MVSIPPLSVPAPAGKHRLARGSRPIVAVPSPVAGSTYLHLNNDTASAVGLGDGLLSLSCGGGGLAWLGLAILAVLVREGLRPPPCCESAGTPKTRQLRSLCSVALELALALAEGRDTLPLIALHL